MLITLIATSGTLAPLESDTVPVTPPRFPCAKAGAVKHQHIMTIARGRVKAKDFFMASTFLC